MSDAPTQPPGRELVNTDPRLKGPRNLRELSLYSAGQYAGMRNVYMARAAVEAAGSDARKHAVCTAREHHHVYLARMREADGAAGYRVPEEITAANYQLPKYEPGWLTRKQA